MGETECDEWRRHDEQSHSHKSLITATTSGSLDRLGYGQRTAHHSSVATPDTRHHTRGYCPDTPDSAAPHSDTTSIPLSDLSFARRQFVSAEDEFTAPISPRATTVVTTAHRHDRAARHTNPTMSTTLSTSRNAVSSDAPRYTPRPISPPPTNAPGPSAQTSTPLTPTAPTTTTNFHLHRGTPLSRLPTLPLADLNAPPIATAAPSPFPPPLPRNIAWPITASTRMTPAERDALPRALRLAHRALHEGRHITDEVVAAVARGGANGASVLDILVALSLETNNGWRRYNRKGRPPSEWRRTVPHGYRYYTIQSPLPALLTLAAASDGDSSPSGNAATISTTSPIASSSSPSSSPSSSSSLSSSPSPRRSPPPVVPTPPLPVSRRASSAGATAPELDGDRDDKRDKEITRALIHGARRFRARDNIGNSGEMMRIMLADTPLARATRLVLWEECDSACRNLDSSFDGESHHTSRAIALPKPNGDIRPVAIGSISNKILNNFAIARTTAGELRALVGRPQLAVAAPNGAAMAANAIAMLIAAHANDTHPWVVVASDAHNAQNELKTSAARQRFTSFHETPVSILFEKRYCSADGGPTIVVRIAGEPALRFSMREGVVQGDSLSTIAYCAALATVIEATAHLALTRLDARIGTDFVIICFSDDAFFVGPPHIVIPLHNDLYAPTLFRVAHVKTNGHKVLVLAETDRATASAHAVVAQHHTEGATKMSVTRVATILGTPRGDRLLVLAALDKQAEAFELIVEQTMPLAHANAHCAAHVALFSVGARLVHLCRTTPPSLLGERLVARADAALRRLWCAIAGTHLSDEVWAAMCLRREHGGAGITTLEATRDIAYAAAGLETASAGVLARIGANGATTAPRTRHSTLLPELDAALHRALAAGAYLFLTGTTTHAAASDMLADARCVATVQADPSSGDTAATDRNNLEPESAVIRRRIKCRDADTLRRRTPTLDTTTTTTTTTHVAVVAPSITTDHGAAVEESDHDFESACERVRQLQRRLSVGAGVRAFERHLSDVASSPFQRQLRLLVASSDSTSLLLSTTPSVKKLQLSNIEFRTALATLFGYAPPGLAHLSPHARCMMPATEAWSRQCDYTHGEAASHLHGCRRGGMKAALSRTIQVALAEAMRASGSIVRLEYNVSIADGVCKADIYEQLPTTRVVEITVVNGLSPAEIHSSATFERLVEKVSPSKRAQYPPGDVMVAQTDIVVFIVSTTGEFNREAMKLIKSIAIATVAQSGGNRHALARLIKARILIAYFKCFALNARLYSQKNQQNESSDENGTAPDFREMMLRHRLDENPTTRTT
jgi:hypothetical protein